MDYLKQTALLELERAEMDLYDGKSVRRLVLVGNLERKQIDISAFTIDEVQRIIDESSEYAPAFVLTLSNTRDDCRMVVCNVFTRERTELCARAFKQAEDRVVSVTTEFPSVFTRVDYKQGPIRNPWPSSYMAEKDVQHS